MRLIFLQITTCHLSAPELVGSEYIGFLRHSGGLTGELLFHRIPGLGYGMGGLQGEILDDVNTSVSPSVLQGGWRL